MPSPEIRIGDHLIGDGHQYFTIAEIGLNHNGDLELAKAMIASAQRAGAECCKVSNI